MTPAMPAARYYDIGQWIVAETHHADWSEPWHVIARCGKRSRTVRAKTRPEAWRMVKLPMPERVEGMEARAK